MELPFAVDATTSSDNDASSLVTASSQGSLVPADDLLHLSSQLGPPSPDLNRQRHSHEDDHVIVSSYVEGETNAFPSSPPEVMRHHQQQQQYSQYNPPHRAPNVHPSFLPTIVDLPPTPPSHIQQTMNASSYSTAAAFRADPTAISATSFGVDALKSAGNRVSSVLSHFGYSRSSTTTSQAQPNKHTSDPTTRRSAAQSNSQQIHAHSSNDETKKVFSPKSIGHAVSDDHPDTEAIDFAYINVTDEDEVDIWLDDSHRSFGTGALHTNEGDFKNAIKGRADILAILLQNTTTTSANDENSDNDTSASSNSASAQLVAWTEQANAAAAYAVTAKREGRLQEALDQHTNAAKLFHEAALLVQEYDGSVAGALLLLSQTQAKSASALKRVIKLKPNALASKLPSSGSSNRLRATVRGALGNKPEADISDSMFLGKATKNPDSKVTPSDPTPGETSPILSGELSENPVDEMMELERELREMDMALALGNSIASLDARTQNRMKSSVTDSFMVIPGSGSYMSSSSSIILGPVPSSRPNGVGGTAGVRARANRVQNVSRPPGHPSVQMPLIATPSIQQQQPSSVVHKPQQPQNLESSWWGNASTASQVLSASVIANGSTDHHQQQQRQTQPANTKQLMRLMDSLRTLGDENAALLREVEDAEVARIEAKTAREQMKRFKEEYGKRFTALKEALERFRKGYPGDNSTNGEQNPVTSSEFSRSASTSDQLQRQEQLIRKLTVDLKKEKEESKKKDAALRKYESFYREVKARSAQKAAQRQRHQLPQPTLRK